MYEAEIKFVIHDPSRVSGYFESKSQAQTETYKDVYLVQSTLVPSGSEREFRVREIQGPHGVRSVLTFKDKVVDTATLSKREFEIEIGNAASATNLFLAMDFEADIRLSKECLNWKFQHNKLQVLATLVTVPELEGHFLELETMVHSENQVGVAIESLRRLAESAGLSRQDETTASYTGSVRSARAKSS